jgi:cytochrome o ubiquinol oxidase subunit 2
MAGMQTRLNLQAAQAGQYMGENSQYSGKGFSFMQFQAEARDTEGFSQWVRQVKDSPKTLDEKGFDRLEKPTIPVTGAGAICGTSGSPAWITNASASCTSCWPW